MDNDRQTKPIKNMDVTWFNQSYPTFLDFVVSSHLTRKVSKTMSWLKGTVTRHVSIFGGLLQDLNRCGFKFWDFYGFLWIFYGFFGSLRISGSRPFRTMWITPHASVGLHSLLLMHRGVAMEQRWLYAEADARSRNWRTHSAEPSMNSAGSCPVRWFLQLEVQPRLQVDSGKR